MRFLGKVILRQGFPRVPSLGGPLLFLVFINDIADETIGLCSLFADDTSIGEKSYEMNSLCNMVNTDLKNISEWSNQWLVKLNPGGGGGGGGVMVMVFCFIQNCSFGQHES